MADRRLQVFHAVVKHGSFTRAAERLFMTQPAVTFQIKQLEEHFDTRLLERGHGKLGLTPAGEIVFDYAERILTLNEELESRVSELTDELAGTLNVGTSTTIAAYWLPHLLEGKRRLSDIDPSALWNILELRLGWDGRKQLDAQAPEMFTTPAGTSHAIDYDAPGGPEVEVRVQALFGLAQHPVIGPQRIPLRLSLTSPAGRPIQTTGDLPGFWAGSWSDVAKEMRGRYPKHSWPDDPASAAATVRTKRASAATKS